MLSAYVEFFELNLVNGVVISEYKKLATTFNFVAALRALLIDRLRFQIWNQPASTNIVLVVSLYVSKSQNVLFYPYVDLRLQIAKPVIHRPPKHQNYGLFYCLF